LSEAHAQACGFAAAAAVILTWKHLVAETASAAGGGSSGTWSGDAHAPWNGFGCAQGGAFLSTGFVPVGRESGCACLDAESGSWRGCAP